MRRRCVNFNFFDVNRAICKKKRPRWRAVRFPSDSFLIKISFPYSFFSNNIQLSTGAQADERGSAKRKETIKIHRTEAEMIRRYLEIVLSSVRDQF